MMIAQTAVQTPISASDPRVTRYLRECKRAGLPRDQAQLFLQGGYIALPSMLPFHLAARQADNDDGPDEVMVGGTRGPGKSHAVLSQIGIDDCQRVAGLKFLFLRKIKLAAAESFEDLVHKVLRYVPHEFSRGRVTFPNGSRIVVGGFKDESDIDKYLGIEYDGIALEEATQLAEKKVDMIGGSVRSTVPGWKARRYYTTNADGIGVKWAKARFVLPARERRETFTRYIETRYADNPFLKPEYIRFLDGLSGALRKAWRDCDWDAFEGMAFPTWSHELHVIDPFEIPDRFPRWRSIDEGTAKPFCCLWFAKDTDTDRIYIYREVYQAGMTTKQQADMIATHTPPDEHIAATYADPAMWAKENRKGEWYSVADEFKENGLMLTQADNARLQGKRKVDNLLSTKADGKPGLLVFRNCVNLISQMENLPLDDIHVEDVDTKEEDHAYDALRYGLTNTARQVQQPEKPKPSPLLKIKSF